MKHRTLSLVLVGLLFPAGAFGKEGVPDWVHRDSADCARCHPLVVKEWRGSRHALSTTELDPLYRFLRDKAVKVMGPKAEKKCNRCHYPPWEDAARKAGIKTEGISCVVCHRVHPGHPDEQLANGRDADFALGPGGKEGAQGLCLACHRELKSPEGHPVCTTGPESIKAGRGSCVDCHMPRVPGPAMKDSGEGEHRAHRFPGAWDRAFLKGTATLGISLRDGKAGREIVVRVQAARVGHSLPTGNPMRAVILRVEALDAKGNVLWRNMTNRPLDEDPGAVFMRVFSDAKGKRPVPPFLASGPSRDNRLEPDEVRTLAYPLPPGTRRLTARAEYSLGPGPLLQNAGLTVDVAAPVVVAEAELDLP